MIRVLAIESEYESAKRLGIPNVSTFLYGRAEEFNNDLIIRWGNSILYNNKDGTKVIEFKNVLNPSKSIHFNCTKSKSLQKLSTVVNTPKFYLSNEIVPENKLVVYRPDEHSGGKGFGVIKGEFKVNPYYYATEFIKTDTEFRVFYCGDKTMICKRITYNPERAKQKFVCRSLWNYSFLKKVPKILHNQVMKAKKVLNMDFGGFDILLSKGKYYFLENNSACTIDKSEIAKFYNDGIKSLIKKKYPKFSY